MRPDGSRAPGSAWRRALLVATALAATATACGELRHPALCYAVGAAMKADIDDEDSALAEICSGTASTAAPSSARRRGPTLAPL